MALLNRSSMCCAALAVALVGMLAMPTQMLAQPIAYEVLLSEDFGTQGDGTPNGAITASATLPDSSWQSMGTQGTFTRDDNHQGYGECCAGGPPDSGPVAIHPGQGGRTSNSHALSHTSFNLSDLPAGAAVRTSFVASFGGNLFNFAPGSPTITAFIGEGLASYGAGGPMMRMAVGKNSTDGEGKIRIEMYRQNNADGIAETISTLVDVVTPNKGNLSAVEVKLDLSTTGGEGFWRPIRGVSDGSGGYYADAGEYNSGVARNDVDNPWTSIGTLSIGGVGLIETFAISSNGPIAAAAIDTIQVAITPEPASLVLLSLGGLALLRRRRA